MSGTGTKPSTEQAPWEQELAKVTYHRRLHPQTWHQNQLLPDEEGKLVPGLWCLGVFAKIARVEADCSINASYLGWRETLWDAQGAWEIKYNVWVAQFEVHYKKAIWIANEATRICMLIRPVSSLVCRVALMARNALLALLRDCSCLNYQLYPADHFLQTNTKCEIKRQFWN